MKTFVHDDNYSTSMSFPNAFVLEFMKVVMVHASIVDFQAIEGISYIQHVFNNVDQVK